MLNIQYIFCCCKQECIKVACALEILISRKHELSIVKMTDYQMISKIIKKFVWIKYNKSKNINCNSIKAFFVSFSFCCFVVFYIQARTNESSGLYEISISITESDKNH